MPVLHLEGDKIPTRQEVNDLKDSVASSLRAHSRAKKMSRESMKKFGGLEECLNNLKICLICANKKGFPVGTLRYIVTDLAAAIEKMDAHKVPQFRDEINKLLMPWLNKAKTRAPIIVAS